MNLKKEIHGNYIPENVNKSRYFG